MAFFGSMGCVANLPDEKRQPLVNALRSHLTAVSAEAGAPQAGITATVSDSTPAAGKAFTVSGTFTENTKAAAGQVVEIQTNAAGRGRP